MIRGLQPSVPAPDLWGGERGWNLNQLLMTKDLINYAYVMKPPYMCAKLLQLCPTLCSPRDCSPPGFSVHRVFQARILKCVAMPFSRGSSQHRYQTHISCRLMHCRCCHWGRPIASIKIQKGQVQRAVELMNIWRPWEEGWEGGESTEAPHLSPSLLHALLPSGCS